MMQARAKKEVDPYEIDSDIIKKALEKGWVPPNSIELTGTLWDTLPKLSPKWNGPLQVMADLIQEKRQLGAAQSLVNHAEPTGVYEFLADVYLTDELEQ